MDDQERTLLIVRHGRGRGRHAGILQSALDEVRRLDPSLALGLRFHETGSGRLPDLEHVATVLCWLADPLATLYPECHAEACAIEARAQEHGIAVLNPPDALSRTAKSTQANTWRAAGIPTPPHVPFASRPALDTILTTASYPLLIKADLAHEQSGLHFCRTRRDAQRVPEGAIRYPGSVVPFVDTRAPDRDVWTHYFHKKRAIVLGRHVCPRSILFSRQPVVGLRSCTFRADHSVPGRWFRAFRSQHRAAIEADNAFSFAPPEHASLLVDATRALGLTSAAIDYASGPDGRPILWEANPYFHLVERDYFFLPEARRFEERRRAFVTALAAFLRDARRSGDLGLDDSTRSLR